MSNFRNFDRHTGFLLPPSVDEWLPEKHLARFVAEVIDALDVSAMSSSYRGSGSASYHPKLLLGLLVYGYACAGKSNAARGHGLPPEDARGQKALRPAQTHPRTSVRHH